MARQRSEIVQYSRQDIDSLVKWAAKMRIIGNFFIGKLHGQEVRQLPDGGLEVITHLTEE